MVAYDRFCFEAAAATALYGELAALGLLDRGTLLLDMVDRVCDSGDMDTAAIRTYSCWSGQRRPGEGVVGCTRHKTRPNKLRASL